MVLTQGEGAGQEQGEGPSCFARLRVLQGRGVSSPMGKGGTLLRQVMREGSEPCARFLGLEGAQAIGRPVLQLTHLQASLGHTLQLEVTQISEEGEMASIFICFSLGCLVGGTVCWLVGGVS